MPDYPAGFFILPDIQQNHPAGSFILPDIRPENPAYPAGSSRHQTSGIRQEIPDPAQPLFLSLGAESGFQFSTWPYGELLRVKGRAQYLKLKVGQVGKYISNFLDWH